MRAWQTRAVVVAALLCGAGVVALVRTSDRSDAYAVWAIFGPVVGWSFIGTGLYAMRRRPESRTGQLMVLMGFAWYLPALSFADSPLVYTIALVFGGLWGGVFLQLVMAFPSGRLASGRDRAIVIAGYVIFTVVSIPMLLFAGPHDVGCDGCPTNVLQIRHDPDLATAGLVFQAVLYVALFVIVLVRLIQRWRRTGPLERLQLTPVYVVGMLTFLLATVGSAGAGDAIGWAAFIVTALLPFAFLAGLLRSHVAHLDAELRARLEELRASRARLVEASDTERRRLERDLHDGAQARLVGVALLLAHTRKRVDGNDLAAELDALAARAPVPVTLETQIGERLPGQVEIAAYFVVCEALANVAKYAQASEAVVAVRRTNGCVSVDVTDDGIGGADTAAGSGLRGLEDRVAALDGTLALESPRGHGTRLHAEIPC
jgi:signal transduction histidine kinase